MLLRPKWMRRRGRWVCAGIGTLCLTTLAITGCSKAPMARFKSMTSASAESTAEATDAKRPETRNASTERPQPGEAVAKTGPSARAEGRVTIVGDRGGNKGLQRYREGYADLRDRVLNRETTASSDPFLDTDRQNSFPSTEELAAPGGSSQTPAMDDSVARADIRSRDAHQVGVTSLQRRPGNAGVAKTTPAPQPAVSRIEQLRSELRKSQATTGSPPGFPGVSDTARGTVLADATSQSEAAPRGTASEAIGVARTSHTAPTVAPPNAAPSNSAAPLEASPDSLAGTSQGQANVALRVQSLLTTAEWMAARGELEQAYRNAMLAQHLADYGSVTIGPHDRSPAETAHKIWELAQRSGRGDAITQRLPKPKLPSAATRAPVPDDAFPVKAGLGWERTEGPSALPQIDGAFPVIAPRSSEAGGPQLPGTSQPSLDHVAAAGGHSPVLISGIEAEPEAAPVVTALAESAAGPQLSSAPLLNTEPTGLTLPAMASLPKTPLTLPPQLGPALSGPTAAVPELEAPPPYLEVMGARQLPEQIAVAEGTPPTRTGILWGLGGLSAILLGCIYAFRRRWAAGTVAKPAAGSTSSGKRG
jgi:hypothetical protein